MGETKEKDHVAEHMRMCGYNDRGEEIPDPRPMELPVGFKHPKPLEQTMRELLRNELFQRELARAGAETFEEADDFEETEGDSLFDRSTPYEKEFDPEHVATREQEIKSGFVQEIPAEKRVKAKETLERWRKSKDEEEKPVKKPKAEKKGDISDDED